MGGRKPLMLASALATLLGFAVYFRLWFIDYSISSTDADLLRKQFDIANREAMDESAEWRMKYDEQVERATMCVKELSTLKNSRREDVNIVDQKFESLNKENIALIELVESLKRELEVAKAKCNKQ